METTIIPVLVLLAAIGVLGIGLAGYLAHKILRIHKMQFPQATRRDLDNLYTQVESLLALYVQLGFERELPRLRGFAASPDFLREVLALIDERRPEVVVEAGSGASTIVVARALAARGHGHLYTLEHDPGYVESSRENLKYYGVLEWATVLNAPLEKQMYAGQEWWWYALQNLPRHQIGLLIVDGPPEAVQSQARYPAVPAMIDRLREDCVVVLDDANREDEQAIVKRWQHEYPEFRTVNRSCEKGCALLFRTAASTIES